MRSSRGEQVAPQPLHTGAGRRHGARSRRAPSWVRGRVRGRALGRGRGVLVDGLCCRVAASQPLVDAKKEEPCNRVSRGPAQMAHAGASQLEGLAAAHCFALLRVVVHTPCELFLLGLLERMRRSSGSTTAGGTCQVRGNSWEEGDEWPLASAQLLTWPGQQARANGGKRAPQLCHCAISHAQQNLGQLATLVASLSTITTTRAACTVLRTHTPRTTSPPQSPHQPTNHTQKSSQPKSQTPRALLSPTTINPSTKVPPGRKVPKRKGESEGLRA
jgi:hypothetical protein